MNKGTILYIGGFELPDKNAAAHRVLNNGKVLREIGYRVVFISIDKNLPFKGNNKSCKENVQGFDCWYVPYPKSNNQWLNYLTNIDSVKMLIKEYSDVKAIICYNYQAFALLRLKKYCNQNDIKLLADCTEWYSTKGSNIVFKIIKGLDSFLRMRVIQKKLDGVIVISKYLENYYNKFNNVLRIPPLVDLAESKWDIKKRYNEIPQFVYVGSPGVNKDKINLVVESFYELKKQNKFVLNIVGISKEQYLNLYKEHESILNESVGFINFIGRISHIESLEYLKIADFSIFLRENTRLNNAGFPTKYVESISCGTIVITTKTSDLVDYSIQDRNPYFIDISSKSSVINDMSMFFQYVNKKSFENLEIKRDIFNYKNYIEQFEIFIKKIM